jgi:hypothetical protein
MLIPRHLLRQDYVDGTYYEGSCLGDRVYSTNGSYGKQFGNCMCAGI